MQPVNLHYGEIQDPISREKLLLPQKVKNNSLSPRYSLNEDYLIKEESK